MAMFNLNTESIELTIIYSVLSAIFLCTACFTFQTTNCSRHAPDCAHSFMLRFGFCLPSVIYCILLATLAVSTKKKLNLESSWTYIIYAIQPVAVPIQLNVLFEICYLVHKNRSVNFAGLEFDQGHRVKILNSRTRSFILRNLIRVVSLALLVMGIVANFNIMWLGQDGRKKDSEVEDSDTSYLVGRIGWWGLHPWTGQVHLLLSLLPTMFLVLVAFYLSIVLWTYGASSSIVVHSSYLNPWCSQFFGTLCMAVGQCFGESLYLVTSHLGYLMLIWSDLYLMRSEISKEIIQTKDFEEFLQHVGMKGNEVSVLHKLRNTSDPTLIPDTTDVSDGDDIDDGDDVDATLHARGGRTFDQITVDVDCNEATDMHEVVVIPGVGNPSASTSAHKQHQLHSESISGLDVTESYD
jgi:hypothetical protein